ncbi:MAG: ATP-binding cassette domain-containing protein [Planctomycetota bacterium]
MAIAAADVSFAYQRGRPVLTDVSASFAPGCITAIVGPNGSGKSTLLRLLLGLRRPASGAVTLDGRDIAAMPPRLRAERLAYVSQTPDVAFPFSARRVAALGLAQRPQAQAQTIADRALEQLGLSDLATRPFGELSVGQRQRVAIARALAQLEGHAAQADATRAMIADEPFSALDPAHAADARRLFRGLAERGIAVICVLHDLSIARDWADDAVLLAAGGTVSARGPAAETLTADRLSQVFRIGFVERPVLTTPIES